MKEQRKIKFDGKKRREKNMRQIHKKKKKVQRKTDGAAKVIKS